MEKIAIDGVDRSPHPRQSISVRRLVGDELGTDRLDVTYYEIEPGGRFAGAYHRHLQREELFVVLSGTATFRTGEGAVRVRAGECIYFEPGDWQLGLNEASEPVTAVLVGSPKELSPVEAYLECPACEEETRFSVDPESQPSGGALAESRVRTRCGRAFER